MWVASDGGRKQYDVGSIRWGKEEMKYGYAGCLSHDIWGTIEITRTYNCVVYGVCTDGSMQMEMTWS